MLPTAAGRALLSPPQRTVAVAGAAGSWTFTPGAGVLDTLTAAVNDAPEFDTVGIGLVAGAGGAGKTLAASVQVGELAAIDPGTATVAAGEAVAVGAENFDGGTFTLSGTVRFTAASTGARTLYILSPQVV